MSTDSNSNSVVRVAERILAAIGAVNCVVIPFFFVQQEPLFPLPGFYLIEVALAGVFGLAATIVEQTKDSRWGAIPWIAAGILLAFIILGMWTIGLFLVPAATAFLVTGFLTDRRLKRPVANHAGIFLLAAVVQAAVMLAIVLFA